MSLYFDLLILISVVIILFVIFINSRRELTHGNSDEINKDISKLKKDVNGHEEQIKAIRSEITWLKLKVENFETRITKQERAKNGDNVQGHESKFENGRESRGNSDNNNVLRKIPDTVYMGPLSNWNSEPSEQYSPIQHLYKLRWRSKDEYSVEVHVTGDMLADVISNAREFLGDVCDFEPRDPALLVREIQTNETGLAKINSQGYIELIKKAKIRLV